MAKQPETVVHVRMELENPKAQRALHVLANTLTSILEDFGYRDDVKRATKAAKYLVKHLTYTVDDFGAKTLLDSGAAEIIDDTNNNSKD